MEHTELSERGRMVVAEILAALWQGEVCELEQTELEDMFVGLLLWTLCEISIQWQGRKFHFNAIEHDSDSNRSNEENLGKAIKTDACVMPFIKFLAQNRKMKGKEHLLSEYVVCKVI